MAFNFETDRRVRQTYLLDRWISTVFLGIDHGYGDKPILFETMVFEFGEMIDIDCARCSTYDEAIKMHYNMIVDHQIKSLRETAAYIGALCFALFSTIQITALASLI